MPLAFTSDHTGLMALDFMPVVRDFCHFNGRMPLETIYVEMGGVYLIHIQVMLITTLTDAFGATGTLRMTHDGAEVLSTHVTGDVLNQAGQHVVESHPVELRQGSTLVLEGEAHTGGFQLIQGRLLFSPVPALLPEPPKVVVVAPRTRWERLLDEEDW